MRNQHRQPDSIALSVNCYIADVTRKDIDSRMLYMEGYKLNSDLSKTGQKKHEFQLSLTIFIIKTDSAKEHL